MGNLHQFPLYRGYLLKSIPFPGLPLGADTGSKLYCGHYRGTDGSTKAEEIACAQADKEVDSPASGAGEDPVGGCLFPWMKPAGGHQENPEHTEIEMFPVPGIFKATESLLV